MSTIVVNRGNFERDTSGNRTTNLTKSFGDQGTVRTVVEGIEYVFGPGESKAFSDDGLASKIAASDARLRVGDSRDGLPKSNASLSNYRW